MDAEDDDAIMADSLPLPRNHAYLEGASAVLQHEVGSRDHKSRPFILPVMFLNFVLFPGSILPIRLEDPNIVSFLRRNIENGYQAKLGIVFDQIVDWKGVIGTIATVTFTHAHGPSSTTTELVATAIGGNRFKVLGPDVDRPFFFLVQEIAASISPMVGPYVQHLPKISSKNMSDQTLRRISMVSGIPLDRIIAKVWPWKLMEETQELLRDRNFTAITNQEHQYPNDPETFSFWLSSNLPINPYRKARLLEAEPLPERFALLKRHIEDIYYASAKLACHRCEKDVAMMKDTFAVRGAEGVSGNYVNPEGYIHQTITVRQLASNSDVSYSGNLESKDSWFPGYRWKIMLCATCGTHLGWRFEPEERFQHVRDPFFAFSSTQVTLVAQEPDLSST